MQARCAANRVAADPGDIALSKYLACTPVHDLVAASSHLLRFLFRDLGERPFGELDIPSPNR
ncbi:hypothetical protein OG301_03580 [Streptomyces platensis]|uniref:hypothetical protein n=1 Tax=Streptomyces platensis TaxID=58346 RepID=UPI002E14EEF7|nr:hypothetical protein OG229_34710 [Streptomyces platensis]WTI50544.1 hypothetical protein OG301_03580 [Streptomyces platensis]WUB83902.1 hypothetical protein OG424_34720 [Streptomyces platensis]